MKPSQGSAPPKARCPHCGQVWPASAPHCLGCDHVDPARRGGQVKTGNLIVYGAAVLVGLAFVVVHNHRRQTEHPPLAVPTSEAAQRAAAGQDFVSNPPAAPPPTLPDEIAHKARPCVFTASELVAEVAPYRAALDACAGNHPLRIRLVFDRDGNTTPLALPDGGPPECAVLLRPLVAKVPAGRNGATGAMSCVLKL